MYEDAAQAGYADMHQAPSFDGKAAVAMVELAGLFDTENAPIVVS